eukprot:240359_1
MDSNLFHYLPDKKQRKFALFGYVRQNTTISYLFSNTLWGLFWQYYEDDVCKLQFNINSNTLKVTKPVLFSIAGIEFSIISKPKDSSKIEFYILTTKIPISIELIIANVCLHNIIDDQKYYKTIIVSTNEHQLTIPICLENICFTSIPFTCTVDILQIKYCSYKFTKLSMLTYTNIDLDIDSQLFESFTTHKKKYFYTQNIDHCWCISFIKGQPKTNKKNSYMYIMGLTSIGLPPMIGYITVDITVSCNKKNLKKTKKQFTFSYANNTCELIECLPKLFTLKTKFVIQININKVFDIKKNIISYNEWKYYGFINSKEEINLKNSIPKHEDIDSKEIENMQRIMMKRRSKRSTIVHIEPENMSGKCEIKFECSNMFDKVFKNNKFEKFLESDVGKCYEYKSIISCMASQFDIMIYPNGLSTKNKNYVQFLLKFHKMNYGLKSVSRLNEYIKNNECFIVFYRLYISEMNIEYQNLQTIKTKEMIFKWPAKTLCLEECQNKDSLEFKAEVKIVKLIKHKDNTGKDGEHTQTALFYYKPHKMKDKFKFRWNIENDGDMTVNNNEWGNINLLQLQKAVTGQCFFSNVFNECFVLRIYPNGRNNNDKGYVRVSLLLLGYPNKIQSITCNVILLLSIKLDDNRKIYSYKG